MWDVQVDTQENDVNKIRLFANNGEMRYADVIQGWRTNHEFRNFYISILKQSPLEAFFWENPPLTGSSIHQAYEFVLVNSPQLSNADADSRSFSRQFELQSKDQSVIRFSNLGGDAELVVPRPGTPERHYAHFAAFLRAAPSAQVHELFVVLADALKDRDREEPVWVSTSGLGVYWLHIRLDRRPKYYTYQPYKRYFEL